MDIYLIVLLGVKLPISLYSKKLESLAKTHGLQIYSPNRGCEYTGYFFVGKEIGSSPNDQIAPTTATEVLADVKAHALISRFLKEHLHMVKNQIFIYLNM